MAIRTKIKTHLCREGEGGGDRYDSRDKNNRRARTNAAFVRIHHRVAVVRCDTAQTEDPDPEETLHPGFPAGRHHRDAAGTLFPEGHPGHDDVELWRTARTDDHGGVRLHAPWH